ncbi:glycosyltransferase [Oscillatoria sp. FACHB-1407]|uniref:glycosyltransferase n=1 Tax=Oscillatoria sp. FACHB-1407 TaxID=2692847 RepID=UPI001682B866|nr:glycosyltransferase [Oscillatoria sp. FACHB-1407]MBD2464447.1 glycosyltransferase [Oscillatoria sp. FACHB-1407]
MPQISVITPVYNGEKTIRETIASVLNQTFTDFEYIIINDSSDDQTLEIIASFSDPRIQVFSYPKGNLPISRNRGITHASGEYLAFLDADDVWTPDKLEAQLNALKANPEAAVAYSWTDYIDEYSQFLRVGSHFTANQDVYAQLLLMNFIENGSNTLIKAEAIAQVGGFDPNLPSAEDWDMWLRLAAQYPFVAVPKVQVLYRVSSQAMTRNIPRMEAACLQVIERAFSRSPDSLQFLKPLTLGNFYKYLTCKALEGKPQRKNALQAARFLTQIIKNDPTLIKEKVFGKLLFRIATTILFPSAIAETVFTKTGKLSDIKTLYGYLRLNPS